MLEPSVEPLCKETHEDEMCKQVFTKYAFSYIFTDKIKQQDKRRQASRELRKRARNEQLNLRWGGTTFFPRSRKRAIS